MKKEKADGGAPAEMEYTRELHDAAKEEREKREAIRILIAEAICARPIMSCGECPRYKNGYDCAAPTDEEIERAVILLKKYI